MDPLDQFLADPGPGAAASDPLDQFLADAPAPAADWQAPAQSGWGGADPLDAFLADGEEEEEGINWGSMGVGLGAGMVSGGLATAGATALAAPFTGPLAPFIGAAVGGLVGGGVGRGASELYEGEELGSTQSLGTAAFDTLAGPALMGAARGIPAAYRGAKHLLSGADEAAETFSPAIQPGGMVDSFTGGVGADEILSGTAGVKTDVGGLLGQAKGIQEDLFHVTGRAAKTAKEIAADVADAPPVMGNAESGMPFIQQGLDAMARIAPYSRTMTRVLKRHASPEVRTGARAAELKNQMRDRLLAMLAQQKAAISSRLTPDQLQKHAREIMKGTYHGPHQASSGRGSSEALGEARKIYLDTVEEVYQMKSYANVLEEVVGTSGKSEITSLRHADDYVYGLLRPELRGKHLTQTNLAKAGVSHSDAADIIAFGTANPKRSIEFQSRLMPEEVYDQNFENFFARMAMRDSDVFTNAVIWGGNPSDEIARASGLAGKVPVPELAKDYLDHIATFAPNEAKMTEHYLESVFAPKTTDEGRMIAWLRAATSNMLLTKNWALQGAEVGKGSAFASRGLMSNVGGRKLATRYNIDASVLATNGVSRSSIDNLSSSLAEEFTEQGVAPVLRGASQKMFAKASPLGLSRTMDSWTRTMGGFNALDTVDDIGRKAAKAFQKMKDVPGTRGAHKAKVGALVRGEKAPALYSSKLSADYKLTGADIAQLEEAGVFSRTMLKQAHEVFNGTLEPMQAAFRLAKLASHTDTGLPILADDLIPKQAMLDGAQSLAGRHFFTTGPGMLPEVMRNNWGAMVFQYRTYLVKAQHLYFDDVIKPMVEGVKHKDPELLGLGVKRFLRATAYSLPPQSVAAVIRAAQAGQIGPNTNAEEFFDIVLPRTFAEMSGSQLGVVGDIGYAHATGDRQRAENIPGVPALGAMGQLLSESTGMVGGPNRMSNAVSLGADLGTMVQPQIGFFKDWIKKGGKAAFNE